MQEQDTEQQEKEGEGAEGRNQGQTKSCKERWKVNTFLGRFD
jgi:hypothetical protein